MTETAPLHDASGLPADLRQRAEHELIQQRGFVRVSELADRFGVSAVTIRTDLQVLEERQLARRVHGGATTIEESRFERSFEEVLTEFSTEKSMIARAGVELLTSGESVLLDVGTTAAAVATELLTRTDLTDLTVFTNGLKIALELEPAHPRISIVVTGGTLRPKQHSLVDPLASPMLDLIRVDTVFIGCNGVDADGGITNVNLPEADVKRRMIDAAARRVVLADHTKIGHRALAQVCPLNEIDAVITNATDQDVLEPIRNAGPEVIVATG